MMADNPGRYVKPKSTAAGHGHLNEKLNCMRLLQVLEDTDEEFYFANNMEKLAGDGTSEASSKDKVEKLGDLDDVVCKVVHKGGKLQFLFVQLKHAINDEPIGTDAEKQRDRTKKYDPKSQCILENIVKKCYRSFLDIRNLFENIDRGASNWNQFFACKFDGCEKEFVYFTTRQVSDEVHENLVTSRQISNLLESILNTKGGTCYKLKQSKSAEINFQNICNEKDSEIFLVFVQNFKLCVEQYHNEDVEKQIKNDMIDFKKDIIYNGLKELLEKWYNSYGNVAFITLNDHFFHNYCMSIYKQDQQYLHANPEIIFEADYLQTLEGNDFVSTVFSDDDLLIQTSLVSNIIRNLGVDDYDNNNEILVIDNTINITLLERSVRPTSSYNRLFVFVHSQPENNFLGLLKQFVQQDGKKLHILFKNDCLNESDQKYFVQWPTAFSFQQLTKETQECYLEKSISFQGIDTKLRAVFEKTPTFISSKIISQLAGGKSIEVGTKMKSLGTVAEYYTQRYFVIRSIDYFLIVFKQNHSTDIHMLHVKENIPFKEHHSQQSNCCITRNDLEFRSKCESYPDRNIHLFEFSETANKIETSIKYVVTQGSRQNLNKFLIQSTEKDVMISEQFLVEKCIDGSPENRNLIISDIPGNGKSTTLIHLSALLHQKFLGTFIVLINLNSIKQKLKIDQKFTTEEAITFITEHVMKMTHIDGEIFKQFCFLTEKVIILIDAFDEISPIFDTTIKSFIEALKTTNIQNFIITTRPHCLFELQIILPATVVHLAKFDEDAQNTFLEKIWNFRIEDENVVVKSENLVKNCAKTLVNFLHSNDKNKNFKDMTGIPLLLTIFSEVHFTDVTNCNETGIEMEMLSESYSFLALYEKYFEVKLDILLMNKLNVKDEMMKQELLQRKREAALNDHTALAFKEIFLNAFDRFGSKFKIDYEKLENPERFGILVKLDHGYNFIHRTFAEYFCAVQLVKLIQTKNDVEFANFLYSSLLLKQEYYVIRTFINDALGRLAEEPSC